MRNLFYSLLILSLASCARPVAKFSYDQQKDRVPANVSFTNTSEKAETYLWDFGDGNTSTEVNPTHQYLLSGKYDVILKAIKGGKSRTLSQEIVLKAPKECFVKMETSLGDMIILLYDDTPLHRDNFVKHAENGFYEDLLFHRVIDGFMVQGGDPNSRGAVPGKRLGTGGPGYQIPAEISTEYAHVKGALAAARQPDSVNPEKKSSGSQFYIVDGRAVDDRALDNMAARNGMKYPESVRQEYLEKGGYPPLDQGYTVFGKVVEGLEVIDAISKVRTDAADRPKEDVKILKVTVIK